MLQDVKLTATNDDQYFVFEDYLYQVSRVLERICQFHKDEPAGKKVLSLP